MRSLQFYSKKGINKDKDKNENKILSSTFVQLVVLFVGANICLGSTCYLIMLIFNSSPILTVIFVLCVLVLFKYVSNRLFLG